MISKIFRRMFGEPVRRQTIEELEAMINDEVMALNNYVDKENESLRSEIAVFHKALEVINATPVGELFEEIMKREREKGATK